MFIEGNKEGREEGGREGEGEGRKEDDGDVSKSLWSPLSRSRARYIGLQLYPLGVD